ncbi:MAG: hypothetical protein ACRBDI_07870 [Alphaproteobacteria bacterium]
MRLKEQSIKNFLKGHMSAAIIDSLMDISNPFSNGEKMVFTGSAIPYYLWHKGKSENYIYKPPSDLDMVLSTPLGNERTISNIQKFRNIMSDLTAEAANHAGLNVSFANENRYDNTLMIKGEYSPAQVQEALFGSRIKEILDQYGIDKVDIKSPITVTTTMDTMVLDNTILNIEKFDCHPNAEESALRYQSLSTSLAFKIARCTLRRGFEQAERRPGDVVDAYNIVNAHGYQHEPALLRIMTVIALALQVPTSFDPNEYTGGLLHRDPAELHEALIGHYKTSFSKASTDKIIKTWEDIVNDVFLQHSLDAPILTEQEDEFITKFLMPDSGNPKNCIMPELLQGTKELKDVFNKHDELAEKIKNSTFLQQRISYRQISPSEIAI